MRTKNNEKELVNELNTLPPHLRGRAGVGGHVIASGASQSQSHGVLPSLLNVKNLST